MSEIEDSDENAVYVEPNIEYELPKEKRQVCRDIVKEIKDFGINQRQLTFLIQLLAMELEHRETMQAISQAVGASRKHIPATTRFVVEEPTRPIKKKIVY